MTSKHGVTGLTRSAAIDYAEYGIRGNSVNLAGTETALVARFGAFVQEEAKAGRGAFPITAKMQSILQLNDPEHRLAKPKEQAAVIPFLLSDNASYLAGRVYATLMLPEEITILERSGARTREVFNTGDTRGRMRGVHRRQVGRRTRGDAA